MENIGDNKYSRERFEQFKAECLKQLNELTYEDDPHVILITSKGHGEVSRKGCACPGFMINAARDIIEAVTGDGIEIEVQQITLPPMAKGGEA